MGGSYIHAVQVYIVAISSVNITILYCNLVPFVMTRTWASKCSTDAGVGVPVGHDSYMHGHASRSECSTRAMQVLVIVATEPDPGQAERLNAAETPRLVQLLQFWPGQFFVPAN